MHLLDHEIAFLEHITQRCRVVEPAAAYEPGVANRLDQLLKYVTEIRDMAIDFAPIIAKLQADVAEQTTVNASAATLIQGLSAQLSAAKADAAAAGATAEQLASLTALEQSMSSNTSALQAAVPANTPAATDQTAAEPAADPAAAPALQSVSADQAPAA